MQETSSLHSLESDVPLDIIINILSSFRTFQYGYLAGLTLVVYDTIITVDQETRFFPITHFNPVTLAFVLIRCCGMFRTAISILQSNLHNSLITCDLIKWGVDLADWLILMCIDYVLCIRIRALYSLSPKDRNIARFIHAFFYVEAAVTFGIVLHLIITRHVDYLDLSGLRPCVVVTATSLWSTYFLWGMILLYQVITIALSVSKTIFLQRSLGNRGVRLTKLILHDQLMYAITVVICGIAHVVALTIPSHGVPSVVHVIIDLMGRSDILSIVGAWMILHLKRAGEESVTRS